MKRALSALFAALLCLSALPFSASAETQPDYSYTYPESYDGVVDPSVPYDPLLHQDDVDPAERHTENAYTPAPRSPLLRSAPQLFAENVSYPRVLLSTSHASVDVIFYGNYCFYDDSGQAVLIPMSGVKYTLSYSNNKVTVSCCGAALFSGTQFKVKEYAPPSGKSNYFMLYHEGYGENLSYYGSLAVYSSMNSAPGLYLVNRVYLEDYLCGVVPYEMGDGFGAAALQAQAVAARNYAYKSITSSLPYDLVDTSSDQVYRGISYYSESAAAVDATKGKLLTYGGAPIEVYYSASNGGVTEIPSHAWKKDAPIYAYTVIKADPYDLAYAQANPKDYLEEVVVPKNGLDAKGLIKNMIKAAYGLSDTEANQISLTSVALSANCAEEDSRTVYETAKGQPGIYFCSHFSVLTLTCSGTYTKDDQTEVSLNSAQITIDASTLENSVYGFADDDLRCFWLIDNELADSQNRTYTVRHGRYGHGVGMSQIGARRMASLNMTAEQILTFYYPGTTLMAGAGLNGRETLEALTALASQPRAVVSDVFVYARPDTASLQLGVARKGSALTVTGESNGFAIVTFDGETGYADKAAFLPVFANITIANVEDFCNVRSGPSVSSTKLGTASLGVSYPLLDAYAAPGWYQINYGGQTAYVWAAYANVVQTVGTTLADYTITVALPSGYTDTVLWVDGVAVPAVAANGMLTATVHNTSAKTVVMYKLKPSGTMQEMYAWTLSYTGGGYIATPLPSAIQNLLTYHGCAVRVTGNTGLRFISGIGQSARAQLLSGAGAEGFKLVEYGTVVMRDISYGVYPFVKGGYDTKFGRSYWGAANDYYIKIDGGRIQFASVMVNIQPANYNTYYGFRSYAILQKDGVQYIFYGGQVARSMYYVCKQVLDANEFSVGSSAYNFVYNIVATVEGNG